MLAALLLSLPSHGQEAVVASSGATAIREQDVLLALAAAPADKRAAVVSDPKLISQIIERLLFNRMLASRLEPAPESIDGESPIVRDARLAEAYMTQAIGSPPNFSRFAAERYAANPAQWRTAETKQVQLLRIEGKNAGNEFGSRYSGAEFAELAATLSVSVQDLSVRMDREKDFEPRFWEAVGQLQQSGDTTVIREDPVAFVVRLEAHQESRPQTAEEARAQIVSELEGDWKKVQSERIMAELQQLDVVVDGDVVIALRDRVLRESADAQ
ncbi:MAG: peptidylprolyl isomerase [Xanthomonadales bacterium]|nr:peptidylprolyl isomerase [Xanthomonadales bacterium]